MNNRKVTIFTPTFNRAYVIEKLYKSLKRQSLKDFEWLVVDDGSTDNTEDLFKNILTEQNEFPISYIKKPNGGQHSALNVGIPNAKGDLFMIVDSDDFLREDAVEIICKYESTIENKSEFAGVSGLRCFHNGKTIGDPWMHKNNVIDATNFERKKLKLLGDKAEAYYTEVLKKYYPIPEFPNENDVQKGILWNRIANAGLKIRWFNENIYYCEYLEDGMTRNINDNYFRNYNGYTLFIKETLKYRELPLLTRWKMLIVYCNISRMKKKPSNEVSLNLEINKLWAYTGFQLSKLIYYKSK